MKKIMIILTITILLTVLAVNAGMFDIDLALDTASDERYLDFDPTEDDWHEVEDWEIDVCSYWGGTEESTTLGTISSGTDIGLSQVTFTVQADVTRIEIPNASTNLYEVSWYVGAYIDDVKYAVRLIENSYSSDWYPVQPETSVSENNAKTGYDSFYSNETYNYAQLGIEIDGEETLLTVDIQEDNGGSSTLSSGTSSGGGSSSSSISNW